MGRPTGTITIRQSIPDRDYPRPSKETRPGLFRLVPAHTFHSSHADHPLFPCVTNLIAAPVTLCWTLKFRNWLFFVSFHAYISNPGRVSCVTGRYHGQLVLEGSPPPLTFFFFVLYVATIHAGGYANFHPMTCMPRPCLHTIKCMHVGGLIPETYTRSVLWAYHSIRASQHMYTPVGTIPCTPGRDENLPNPVGTFGVDRPGLS